MRLLLDTHVAIWWVEADARLSTSARAAILDEDAEILLSAVVTWEEAIKRAAGKLRVADGWIATLLRAGARELPVTIAHAQAVAALPAHHRDPFDRLLVAQAQVEGAALVTADERLAAYDVPIVG